MQTIQPVDVTSGSVRLQAAARRYDSLWITIRAYRQGDAKYFQATLQQRGAAIFVDSFRKPEVIQTVDVQMLRRSYNEQLRVIHELAAAGFPISTDALDLRQLQNLGRRVSEVLPASVRQGIIAGLQRARRRRRGLRLTLEVVSDAQELLAIPWELMALPLARGVQADESGELFLFLNGDVTLVRQVQGVGRNTAPALIRPLELQAFAATPADASPIDILAPTRAAVERVLPPGAADRCWYDGDATLDALQERLRESSPQVLHLLCHGEQSDTGRGIRSDLLLTHADGYTHRVSAAGLAPVLTLAPDLQLVMLQACHAGAAAAPDPTDSSTESERERRASESIALALVRHGAPIVVAMQGAVGQAAAGAFAHACYAAIAEGGSVEQAIAAGRIAMWAAGGVVDWSLPVVYQGSGQPEPDIWYGRLADRIDGAFHDPSTSRTLRGGVVALALVLLVASVLRWLLLPPSAAPALDALRRPLAAWLLLGLAGPAVIAAAHRGVRARADLSAAVRRAALRAQWMGAYLGYALGGIAGMAVLASLWVLGLLAGMPVSELALVGAVVFGALFMSYTAARSQVRAALAIVPFEPALFDSSTLGIVLIAMLALLVAPFGLFLLPGTSFAFLLDPAPGALVMSVAIISLVLRFRE
jgi:CHAT domain-containing protein